jgi:hypothetical protein
MQGSQAQLKAVLPQRPACESHEIAIEIGTPERTRSWTLGAVGWASRMLSARIRMRPPYAPLPHDSHAPVRRTRCELRRSLHCGHRVQGAGTGCNELSASVKPGCCRGSSVHSPYRGRPINCAVLGGQEHAAICQHPVRGAAGASTVGRPATITAMCADALSGRAPALSPVLQACAGLRRAGREPTPSRPVPLRRDAGVEDVALLSVFVYDRGARGAQLNMMRSFHCRMRSGALEACFPPGDKQRACLRSGGPRPRLARARVSRPQRRAHKVHVCR